MNRVGGGSLFYLDIVDNDVNVILCILINKIVILLLI